MASVHESAQYEKKFQEENCVKSTKPRFEKIVATMHQQTSH